MKRFDEFSGLLKEIGVTFSSHRTAALNELNNFLECVGSNIVESKEVEPETCFNFELDGINYQIGVTSVKTSGDDYIYYFWLV